ncbi:MAG: hypothetical protein WDM77_14835 [Steroidobacteraceae bacterium]
MAQASSAVIGFGIFGAAVAIYATGAITFPARVRATGMGVVMSAGRVGSIFGAIPWPACCWVRILPA